MEFSHMMTCFLFFWLLHVLTQTLSGVKGGVLQKSSDDNTWTPANMTLEEWRTTWGQGHDRYDVVRRRLDDYSRLVARNIPTTKFAQNNLDEVRWHRDDIVYTLSQVEALIDSFQNHRDKRALGLDLNGAVSEYKWTRPIPYKIEDVFNDFELGILNYSLSEWSRLTCLTFDLRPLDDDMENIQHVLFTKFGNGCYSYVGKIPPAMLSPPQIIHMESSCFNFWGISGHEIAHALGMYHEQQRPDRDDYLTLNWANIPPDETNQFAQIDDSVSTVANTPYEYSSLMQYSAYAFADDANYPSMWPKDSTLAPAMGQRTAITFFDAMWMNNIYCKDECPTDLPCQNGGYTDPKNCSICRCPDEWGGQYCEEIREGTAECSPVSGVVYLDVNETVCVSSPNYNGGSSGRFYEGDSCTWRIQAPSSSYGISMWVDGPGRMLATTQGSCFHWVELKYSASHAITGHRLCGTAPFGVDLLNSTQSTVTAMFRAHPVGSTYIDSLYLGFRMCFTLSEIAPQAEQSSQGLLSQTDPSALLSTEETLMGTAESASAGTGVSASTETSLSGVALLASLLMVFFLNWIIFNHEIQIVRHVNDWLF